MADALVLKQIEEGAAIVLEDRWDKVLGTHVLTRHWERSYTRQTQEAIEHLNSYASAGEATTPTIYVNAPTTRYGDIHAGLWRHVSAVYQKPPHDDHGITQTLYRVYSPDDVDELAALIGRYVYGHQVANLFGFEEGTSEYAAVTFSHLKPDKATADKCQEFSASELLEKVLGLYQTIPGVPVWAYADRRWDDRTQAGTATFTVAFSRVLWAKTWADKRDTSRRGLATTRFDDQQLETRGVAKAALEAQYDGITGVVELGPDGAKKNYAIAGKSYSMVSPGEGALSAQVTKINTLADAKLVRVYYPTINDGEIKIAGHMVVEWRSINAADLAALEAAFDACGGKLHPATGTEFSLHTFPLYYICNGGLSKDDHPTDPATYTVTISAVDGSMMQNIGGIIDYGWTGPIVKREEIVDGVSGQITGFREYHLLKRTTAGRETANAVAAPSSEGDLHAQDSLFHIENVVDANVTGEWGKWEAWIMYWVRTVKGIKPGETPWPTGSGG